MSVQLRPNSDTTATCAIRADGAKPLPHKVPDATRRDAEELVDRFYAYWRQRGVADPRA